MQLKRLCFDQPADETDGKIQEKHQSKGRRRQCAAGVSRFVRRSVQKFLDSKWYGFCRQEVNQFSGMYHDTEGVKMSEEEEAGRANPNPKTFSYSELYIGSRGFSPEELLGSGGFGRVYRAVLPSDGTVVAVKCLAEKGEQFEKTFAAELVAVAHLRHRNLVRLRGWCIHDDQLLLVYDYMPNRSLDRLIFRKSDKKPAFLDWEQRKKIVNGLAAALYYLHEQLETQIIHRDVKTSNVMLDSNFNARLGDFGLARWLEHKDECRTPSLNKNQDFRLVETTKMGGTIGYLPPESFQKRSYATAKSDVFSFGIVVLEVVSGRRAVDLTYQDNEIILLDWIRRLCDEKLLLEAADPRLLDGSYRLLEMETMAKVGLLCTLHDPQSRPSMKWAVDVLSGNFYGNLPALPSFKSLPLYISLSSSPSDFSSNYTITTRTSATSKSSTSFANVVFNSSNFVTANGETLYVTAEIEMEKENSPSSSAYSRKIYARKSTFPVVETPRVITFQEIISATNDFADSQRVAEVDFGTAYHGFLSDSENNRHHVLVKRLGMKTCPALRVRFSNELQNVGRLRHRNLVQLRGWCTEQGEMLVVYDYSASHLLSHALFHHRNKIRWDHRYSIIRSLASAVHYLHEEWDEQVIHRSITSSAVLLDEELNPRLGSFALAEFLARNENGEHVIVDKKKSACGIFGYMSPEYMDRGEATTMADVYSFGVVVLEVVTGKMAVDFRCPEVLLVRKVHEFEEQRREYQELADPRLDGKYNVRELRRLVKLGIACTSTKPESRPSMKQIVSILDGYDQWLVNNVQKEEKVDEWKLVNASSLSLIRRIQALGIQ